MSSIAPLSPRTRLTPLALALALSLVAGCTGAPTRTAYAAPATAGASRAAPSVSQDWALAEQALRSRHWAEARLPLSRLLQQDLRNPHLQYLHALVEENQARDQDRARLTLAAAGYANAARFAQGQYWPLLRLGFLELEQGDFNAAQGHFAEAALDQPERWEAFYGLGVASYYGQDLGLAQLAADRAQALSPDQPEVRQLRALSLAVAGDAEASALARDAFVATDGANQAHLQRRVAQFLAVAGTAAQAGGDFGSVTADFTPETDPDAQDPFAAPPSQVVVEVTILLSSGLDQSSRGVNLFDGLRMLYGYSNTLAQTINSFGREGTRTITSQISTPQLDYSLNLFNDSGQHYSVVARPSITAHIGRESEFFAGRTLNVEVSGINLGQLQPIDVGVRLKVTPELIDQKKVTFQVGAERSFLSLEQIGTFDNSLTTFRQSVSATADVAFGETLVLSALSEEVSDRAFSKIPVVGDIPVLGMLAKRETDSTRQESLLILVTPKLPMTLSTPDTPSHRQQTAQALLAAWNQRIDPRSDVQAVLKRLQRTRWLRPPEAGDLSLRLPRERELEAESVAESLLLAKR